MIKKSLFWVKKIRYTKSKLWAIKSWNFELLSRYFQIKSKYLVEKVKIKSYIRLYKSKFKLLSQYFELWRSIYGDKKKSENIVKKVSTQNSLRSEKIRHNLPGIVILWNWNIRECSVLFPLGTLPMHASILCTSQKFGPINSFIWELLPLPSLICDHIKCGQILGNVAYKSIIYIQ